MIALNEASKNRATTTRDNFESLQRNLVEVAMVKTIAAVATAPSANNLVTFTGSVTAPVITTIAIPAEPNPSNRAKVFSASTFIIAQSYLAYLVKSRNPAPRERSRVSVTNKGGLLSLYLLSNLCNYCCK